MYLQAKALSFVQTPYWKDIVIKQMHLYEDNWKRVRAIKLDSEIILDIIKQSKLTFSSDSLFSNQSTCTPSTTQSLDATEQMKSNTSSIKKETYSSPAD